MEILINEKHRDIIVPMCGTIYEMRGLDAIPKRVPITKPRLRSGVEFESEWAGRVLSDKIVNAYGMLLYPAGTPVTWELLRDVSRQEIEIIDVV